MTEQLPPGHFEDLAIAAERRGDWREAAELWQQACGATLGHNRADRYRERERRARALARGAQECDECNAVIPAHPGGSLANKYHAASCSLYDAGAS